MSGDGQPTLETDGSGLMITIVSGLWHNRIADGLFAGAQRVQTTVDDGVLGGRDPLQRHDRPQA
jgi:hypothetical protein